MPKFITVDVSRKQFTQILVAVPDDYEESALWQRNNIDAIKYALSQDKHTIWEIDHTGVKVEGFGAIPDCEAVGYIYTDISSKLAEVGEQWARLREVAEKAYREQATRKDQ